MTTPNHTLTQVAHHLRQAENILFITGAGLSADSGLPTYRGIGGLYEEKTTEEGIPIEVALSGRMLEFRPALSWKYLWEIGKACRGAAPNRGHMVMAEIERWKPKTWVLTQNVDGLHWQAGSRNLIEIHGRGEALYCVACDYRTTAAEMLAGYEMEVPLPPKCPECDGLIRPDVVLFGEMLPLKAVQDMRDLTTRPLDLVFSIGTSSLFPYITQPVLFARDCGIPTVEINLGETDLSNIVDYRLQLGAAAALGQLWENQSSAFNNQ